MLRISLAAAALFTTLGVITAPAALADPPYRNCTEAHQDGRYDIPQGDEAYWPAGDRDQDGIACES